MAAFCWHADGRHVGHGRTLIAIALLLGAAASEEINGPLPGCRPPSQGECSTPPRTDDVMHPSGLALLQRDSQQRPVSALALDDDTSDTRSGTRDAAGGTRSGTRDTTGTNMTLSMSASLDEKGYKKVANSKSGVQMRIFMRRVLGKLGLNISDEEEFRRVVPYYSGEKSVQSYASLVEELEDPERSGHYVKSPDEHPGTSAALTEEGYQKVARLKSDEEMESFMRRFINSMSLKVVHDDGLSGVVPWYSGTQNIQDLARLQDEIVKHVNERSWVAVDPSLVGSV